MYCHQKCPSRVECNIFKNSHLLWTIIYENPKKKMN